MPSRPDLAGAGAELVEQNDLEPGGPAADAGKRRLLVRDNELSTSLPEDLVGDDAGDAVGGEHADAALLEMVAKVLHQGRPHKVGVGNRGQDAVRLVDVLQLNGQRLVEGQGSGLGGRVVGALGQGDEGGHAGHGHDVALVDLDHVREELLHQGPVRQAVDVKDLVQKVLGHLEDGQGPRNAGVVDQDGRVAQVLPDGVGGLGHGVGRRDITLVVADERVGGKVLWWVLDIQDGDLDSTGYQALDDAISDSATAARHDGDFAGPVPALGRRHAPAVGGHGAEALVDGFQDSQAQQDLEHIFGNVNVEVGREVLQDLLLEVVGRIEQRGEERPGEIGRLNYGAERLQAPDGRGF